MIFCGRVPNINSAVDSNAVIEGSKEALDELADAIKRRDESVIGGIDAATSRPKFLRFRIPSALGHKIPLPMKDVFDMVVTRVSFFFHSDEAIGEPFFRRNSVRCTLMEKYV